MNLRENCINESIKRLGMNIEDVKYLEIGLDKGFTFEYVNAGMKWSVDPYVQDISKHYLTHNMTSDEFFKTNEQKFNVIFIDGLHHSDQVKKDFENAVKCIEGNGYILLDDVLPFEKDEQERITVKHRYINGILMAGECAWTGDVWKFVYYLLKNFLNETTYEFFLSPHTRGVVSIEINDKIRKLTFDDFNYNDYDYERDFITYTKFFMN